MNNITKLKHKGFELNLFVDRNYTLRDKQLSFVKNILSEIENSINSLDVLKFNELLSQLNNDDENELRLILNDKESEPNGLFKSIKDDCISKILSLNNVKNADYLKYCTFDFYLDEHVPKEVIISDDVKDDNILKLLNDIRIACKKLSVYRPTITYIDKNTIDLTTIPKSRFTGEYPTFKVSSKTFYDDDIYLIVGQDFETVKDFLEYVPEEHLDDYPFYSQKYLDDLNNIDEDDDF